MLAGRKKMMGFAPNISRNISLFFSDPSMGVNYSRNGCFSFSGGEGERGGTPRLRSTIPFCVYKRARKRTRDNDYSLIANRSGWIKFTLNGIMWKKCSLQ